MSLCVRDILKGIVSLDQVVLINAGTMVDTCDELKELIEYYQGIYWCDWSIDKCTVVVETLLFTQRLHQERILSTSNKHLVRSIDLHQDRFGIVHSPNDVKYTFELEGEDAWRHVNGPFELGSHWTIAPITEADLNQGEGGSKCGDRAHPDAKFIEG